MSGTELYHRANIHTDRREKPVPGQKYIYFAYRGLLGGGATVPYYRPTFRKLSRPAFML